MFIFSSVAIILGLMLSGWAQNNVNYFTWDGCMADALLLSGLVLGVGMSRFFRLRISLAILGTAFCLALVLFAATMAGVTAGIIRVSVGTQSRVTVGGLYAVSWLLSAVGPFLFSVRRSASLKWVQLMIAAAVLAAIAIVLFIGLYTTTRSVVLQALFFAFLTAAMEIKVEKLIVFGFFVFLVGALIDPTPITDRVLSLYGTEFGQNRRLESSLSEESRAIELGMMMSELGWRGTVTGFGLGSQFPSIAAGSNALVSTPHIGAMTFLLKGGLFLLVPFVVVPAIVAVRRIRTAKSGVERGSAAGVLAYVAMASVSGGSMFMNLLLLGYFSGNLFWCRQKVGASALGTLDSIRSRPPVMQAWKSLPSSTLNQS